MPAVRKATKANKSIDDKLYDTVHEKHNSRQAFKIGALLSLGANPNYVRRSGLSIIEYAAKHHTAHILQTFLDHPTTTFNARSSNPLNVPLLLALRNKRDIPEEILLAMLKRTTERGIWATSCLHLAVDRGRYRVAIKLIENRWPADDPVNYHLCVKHSAVQVASALRDNNYQNTGAASIDCKPNMELIERAVSHGDFLIPSAEISYEVLAYTIYNMGTEFIIRLLHTRSLCDLPRFHPKIDDIINRCPMLRVIHAFQCGGDAIELALIHDHDVPRKCRKHIGAHVSDETWKLCAERDIATVIGLLKQGMTPTPSMIKYVQLHDALRPWSTARHLKYYSRAFHVHVRTFIRALHLIVDDIFMPPELVFEIIKCMNRM